LVDRRLKDSDVALGDFDAIDASDEFFGLAGEHRAADDLYSARMFRLGTVIFYVHKYKDNTK
jgi:hypothetical protein